MAATLEWTTTPKQSFFLSRDEDEILFGGRPGGGKTLALLLYTIKRRTEYPGTTGLFIRRKLSDLKKGDSAIPLSHQLLSGIAAWNGTDLKWTFPNGSVIEFGHCEHEDDKYAYKSAQYADLVFDELTAFTESQYTFIAFSRGRTLRASNLHTQIRCATNPGDIGNAWVYKRFLEPCEPYKTYTYEVRVDTGAKVTRTRMFIPSSFWDNPFLNQEEYAAALQEITDPAERKAMAGRWDIFEGQAFPQWGATHIIRPFQVPVEWPRWYTVDYGYEAPWCCLWITQNLDLWLHHKLRRYYVYREEYGPGVPAWRQAQIVKRINGDQRIHYGVADGSMWQGYEAGTSLIGHYEKIGLFPRKAPTGTGYRATAKGHVDWMLAPAEDGLPHLQVTDNCLNLIKTLPMLQYDKDRPEDVETEGPDHAFDALKGWACRIVGGGQRHQPVEYRICA